MGPLLIPAIMAAAYLTKSMAVDKPKEDRQRHLRAEEQRYSPWSGVHQFQNVEEADPFGATLGGAAQGYGLGQNLQAAENEQNLNDALVNRLDDNGGKGLAYNKWLNQQPELTAPEMGSSYGQKKTYGF